MAAVRAIAFGTIALGACVGGVDNGGQGSGSGSGSGSNPDASIDAPKLMWPDAAPGTGNNLPCKNLVSPAPDLGHHNPGKSCFQQCHNHQFTLAGTLYTNATGNSAFAGATISITDANNNTMDLVVNANGNFWTRQAIAFPVLVIASACPSAVKMTLASANGNCNSCHVGGTNDQMHLP